MQNTNSIYLQTNVFVPFLLVYSMKMWILNNKNLLIG